MYKLHTVKLGDKETSIPIARFGDGKGKKLVITAGADGDEFASIEAAYRIAGELNGNTVHGTIIVLPILNILGFQNVSSTNPLDNKYPKYIYPGNKNGTPSEQLIAWFDEEILSGANVWLDLHGGAITEILKPYVYAFETGNEKLDEIITRIIKRLDVSTVIVEKSCAWEKVDLLGQKGIIYFLAEAGCSGNRDEESIKKHLSWAKTIMASLEMIDYKELLFVKKEIYRNLYNYKAPISGIWYPSVTALSKIRIGQLLGEIKSVSDKSIGKLISKHDGKILYFTESMSIDQNENLIEIAFNNEK